MHHLTLYMYLTYQYHHTRSWGGDLMYHLDGRGADRRDDVFTCRCTRTRQCCRGYFFNILIRVQIVYFALFFCIFQEAECSVVLSEHTPRVGWLCCCTLTDYGTLCLSSSEVRLSVGAVVCVL